MSLAFSDPDRTSPDFLKLWTKAAEAMAGEGRRSEQQKRAVSRYRHLLSMRFALVNLAAVALVFVAAMQGWVGSVLFGDETRLTQVILAVFVLGWVVAAWRTWEISHALNASEDPRHADLPWVRTYIAQATKKDAGARSIAASSLRMQLAGRIAFVKHIANSLVLLGLIGTVIGFVIALSGVDASTAGDPSAIAPMVGSLIRGMGVALYTTLAGAVLNLWLMVNYHMLTGGASRLVSRMVEAAEDAALETRHESA